MAELDGIIRNAVIVDGTGRAPFEGDLGIRDGRIVAVGRVEGEAGETYDAQGAFVGPGFVDTHTHFDVQVFGDPVCADANENGVTTVVMANCGFGLAPCRPQDRERSMLMLESVEQIPVDQQREQLPWTWESFAEFVAALEVAPKAMNTACFLPLNPALVYVMGREAASSRRATEVELAELRQIVRNAMVAGAAGISISKMEGSNLHRDHDGSPMPTDVMDTDLLIDIAAALQGFDRGVVQCLSGVPGRTDQTVIGRLAEASGRPVLQNLIPTSDFRPDVHVEPLRWLDAVNEGDATVFAASFIGRGWTEVNVGTSAVHDQDPNFRRLSFAESDEARLALLRDPAFRSEIRDGYRANHFIGSNGVLERFCLADAAGCVELEPFVGVVLSELAERQQRHVVDVYLDMALASGGRAWFNCGSLGTSDPAVTAGLVLHDRVIAGGSDGGAHLQNFNGTAWTTDLLTWLVRDTGVLTVEQLHHRLSYVPSRLFGFDGRGEIAPGKVADLVVYDLDELFFNRDGYRIVEHAGGWRKRVEAGGYRWVFVGGQPTYERGTWTGRTPGSFVRPSPARRPAPAS